MCLFEFNYREVLADYRFNWQACKPLRDSDIFDFEQQYHQYKTELRELKKCHEFQSTMGK